MKHSGDSIDHGLSSLCRNFIDNPLDMDIPGIIGDYLEDRNDCRTSLVRLLPNLLSSTKPPGAYSYLDEKRYPVDGFHCLAVPDEFRRFPGESSREWGENTYWGFHRLGRIVSVAFLYRVLSDFVKANQYRMKNIAMVLSGYFLYHCGLTRQPDAGLYTWRNLRGGFGFKQLTGPINETDLDSLFNLRTMSSTPGRNLKRFRWARNGPFCSYRNIYCSLPYDQRTQARQIHEQFKEVCPWGDCRLLAIHLSERRAICLASVWP